MVILQKNSYMNKLQRFFSDNWTIQRHEFENTVSLLLPCIINGNIDAATAQLNKEKCTIKATSSPYMAAWYELDDITLPVNSIAVINLTGVLYSWESEWVIRQVEAAELNPNICGIVFVIDGPGGMVSHLDMEGSRFGIERHQTGGHGCNRHYGFGSFLAGHGQRPHVHSVATM